MNEGYENAVEISGWPLENVNQKCGSIRTNCANNLLQPTLKNVAFFD